MTGPEHAVHEPRLSLIVIFYNMAREAPRTLHTLSSAYQQGVSASDYEVIAVDNGSDPPLDPAMTEGCGTNFRHIRIDDASPSPAPAINQGVASARGEHVGIMIDGARMASPGILRNALICLERFERPVVTTVGFHLGPDQQTRSVLNGYCQAVEDRMLAEVDWQGNGYELYKVSVPAGSSRAGWFGKQAESNLIFLPRGLYDELGGFDERFDLPGGGIVNLDFYRKACEAEGATVLGLFGEATFHQFHGGTMANRPSSEVPDELARYKQQYEAIHGFAYTHPLMQPVLYGKAPVEAMRWVQRTSAMIADAHDEEARQRALDATPAARPADEAAPSKAGDSDYRAYVGDPQNYDRVAALQFSLLTLAGLREQHRLLDVGCGSLRGGRLFIPYLRKGNYFGLEPNRWLVEKGIEQEIGNDQMKLKSPRFDYNAQFNLAVFGERFDFVLAQSIFSHTGLTQLGACLESVAKVLQPEGLLVATFVERHEDLYEDEWVYPGLNQFRWQTIQDLCAGHGMHACKIDWPHPIQTWFIAAREASVLDAALARGLDALPEDVILTPRKYGAKRGGAPFSFYRQEGDDAQQLRSPALLQRLARIIRR